MELKDDNRIFEDLHKSIDESELVWYPHRPPPISTYYAFSRSFPGPELWPQRMLRNDNLLRPDALDARLRQGIVDADDSFTRAVDPH